MLLLHLSIQWMNLGFIAACLTALSKVCVVGVWSTAPLQRRVGQWVLLAEQLGLIGVISPAISVASWDWREDGCSGNKSSEKLHRDLEKVSNKT